MCESDRDHLIEAIDGQIEETEKSLIALEIEMERLENSLRNLEKQRREILINT